MLDVGSLSTANKGDFLERLHKLTGQQRPPDGACQSGLVHGGFHEKILYSTASSMLQYKAQMSVEMEEGAKDVVEKRPPRQASPPLFLHLDGKGSRANRAAPPRQQR